MEIYDPDGKRIRKVSGATIRIDTMKLLKTGKYKCSGEQQQMKGEVEEVKENNESISWVNCMYQTKDGIIWIGTINGMMAYYGTDFKHYRLEPNNTGSLPSNHVRYLGRDNRILWIS